MNTRLTASEKEWTDNKIYSVLMTCDICGCNVLNRQVEYANTGAKRSNVIKTCDECGFKWSYPVGWGEYVGSKVVDVAIAKRTK